MNDNKEYYYRYVSLKKLNHFLDTKSLYLSRIDKFEDNLEGIDDASILRKIISTKKADNPLIGNENIIEIRKFQNAILNQVKSDLINRQKQYFATCWFLSDHESMAMWDLYAKNAFLVRYQKNVFDNKINMINKRMFSFKSGLIDYVNFNDIGEHNGLDGTNEIDLFFRKSKAFENEKEYRIVVKKVSLMQNYYVIRDFYDSIDFEIFTSPRMNNLDFDIYKEYVQSKFNIEIKQSEIKDIIQFRENNF